MKPPMMVANRFPSAFNSVETIAAIVPVLNEAALIRPCVDSLFQQARIKEVIVADGGSTDDTLAVAKASGARVVSSPARGRGYQISEGIRHTAADVILVIHADCRLAAGAAEGLLAALNADPFIAGGAFNMRFTESTARLRFVAWLNHLRMRLTGISFGDQGQFVRREALNRCGGFPAQMLMEDVELSLRLKQAGKTAFLPLPIHVSPRRWHSQRFVFRIGLIMRLFFHYLLARRLGKRMEEVAKTCYSKYYR